MHYHKDSEIGREVHHVTTEWKGKMHFESCVNEHIVHMDKLPVHGGEGMGSRPKQLLLSAIGGCTGMEVISILNKMRLKISKLEIRVNGELSNDTPKTYTAISILFSVGCSPSDRDKIEKAIHLAAEKYCGVVAMARKFAEVKIEVAFSRSEME
jgi:putative redox protein